jgi:hypothetical protein
MPSFIIICFVLEITWNEKKYFDYEENIIRK